MKAREAIKDIYPLTPMQKGMLFHHISNRENDIYFQQDLLTMCGPLEPEMVEHSLQILFDLNDIFRTLFIYENVKEFVQIVLKQVIVKVDFVDFSLLSEKERDGALKSFIAEDKEKKISLSSEIPVRVSVAKMSEHEHVLIWSYHHIIMDGWCLGLVISDFFAIYGELTSSVSDFEKFKRPEYGTYLKWLMKKDVPRALAYWDSVLDGYDTDIKLPCSKNISDSTSMSPNIFSEATFRPNEAQCRGIQEYCRTANTTISTFFETIWGFILGKYNNSDDVVFAKVVSGRPPEIDNVDEIIGLFINTIPVRIQWSWEDRFSELVDIHRCDATAATEFDYAPLYEVQARSSRKNSLINHVFVVQNHPSSDDMQNLDFLSHLGISVKAFTSFEATNYDLAVVVNAANLEWNFRYAVDRFDDTCFKALFKHLETCIDIVISNPDVILSDIDLLSDNEKKELLSLHDNRACEFPRHKTICSVFSDICKRFSEKIALSFNERTITYRELEVDVNRLAGSIYAIGIKPGSIISIKLERSVEMIVSMLAVLRVGCAYLPISADLPDERVDYLLEDSGAVLLLCSEEDKEKYQEKVAIIDPLTVEGKSIGNLPEASPRDIAYIIYTSGTTGKPKGVMIDHHNVIRLLFNDGLQFDFDENDVWSFFHSYNFDFSVWEMYGALLYGGRLVIVPKETTKDTNIFLDLLDQEKVTVLNQTPQAFYNLSNFESLRSETSLSVRYVIFGGEALAPGRLRDWNSRYPSSKLINMYGITETTVHVTFKEISKKEIDSKESNIGVPIPTNSCYVFDPAMKLSPRGVPGELCVGGEGVGHGYLNNSELTAMKFLENPYRKGERLYRSGDLVMLSDEGEIIYMGRMDHQVKIRGFRIELGEIEHTLREIPQVENAVVLPFEKGESTSLAAFIVVEEGVGIEVIRLWIENKLPDYMVPEVMLILNEIPLTVNGKINRASLFSELKTVNFGERNLEKANTEIGKKIEKIWETVLKTDIFGINEDFFMVGGNSILAAQLVFQYNREFEVTLPFQVFFDKPTISGMENFLSAKDHVAGHGETLEKRMLEDSSIDNILPDKEASPFDHSLKHIMLTGASGFLGAFLLRDLLEMTDATVYCHVRAEDDSLGVKKIRNNLEYYEIWQDRYSTRIVSVVGDLEQERLGIDEAQYERLAGIIDTIIHNGAVANFSYSYDKLIAVNGNSVHEIVRFATKRKLKAIHYVSTNSIFGSVDKRLIKETDIPFSEDVISSGGYVQTKWVGERIATASRSLGIPVNVYRPGRIGGSRENGACNNSDMLWQFVKLGVLMGSIFDSTMPMDIIPVDFVSRAIIEIVLNVKAINAEYHLFNGKLIDFNDIVEWTRELFEINLIPYEQWNSMVANSEGTLYEKIASQLIPLLPENASAMHSEYVRLYDDTNVINQISLETAAMKDTDKETFMRTLKFMERKGGFDEGNNL